VPTKARLSDILANAITHGIGAVLALVAAVWLVVAAWHGPVRVLVSCSIFAGSLVLVYVCSTLYHSLVRTRARHVFHVLDHSAIYVLIAGTYTPFTLVTLRGLFGWWLFGIVWVLAVAGVVFKSLAMDRLSERRYAVASAVVYLLQGWLIAFAARQLFAALGWHGVLWVAAGGAAYTLGVAFYALDRLRYFHATWHVFVLAGSAAHFFAILYYVASRR